MATKTKVSLLVAMVGLVYAVLSFAHGSGFDLSVLQWTTKIATVIWTFTLLFLHYGWRFRPFSWLAASPDLRGTWRFTNAEIVDLDDRAKTTTDGYLVVRQSETDIDVRVLWSEGGVSHFAKANAPTAVHRNKVCFAGTYVYDQTNAERGFVAYLTAPVVGSKSMTVRYRTDHEQTGRFDVNGRTSKLFDTYAAAQQDFDKRRTFYQKLVFALSWM